MRQEQAAADAMIAASAALGRWDDLERAVDLKIIEQQEFVAVWEERVRAAGQPRIVAEQATILSAPYRPLPEHRERSVGAVFGGRKTSQRCVEPRGIGSLVLDRRQVIPNLRQANEQTFN
jgi:hypothetical protein